MSDNEIPLPDGMAIADGEERPGEPLYPGESTIVTRGNRPLSAGEEIQVWFKYWADGHGTETLTGTLAVIPAVVSEDEDGDDGSVYAILSGRDLTTASRVYKLRADLKRLESALIIKQPSFDVRADEFTVTRTVQHRGQDSWDLLEARTLGQKHPWDSNYKSGL